MNVDVMAGHVISVRITQTNFQYEPTTIDTGLTLLIGDSCNNLICYEDMWVLKFELREKNGFSSMICFLIFTFFICSQPVLNEFGFFEKLLPIEIEANAGHVHLIHHRLS